MNFSQNQKIIDAVKHYPIMSSFGIIIGKCYTPIIEIKNKHVKIRKHLYKFIHIKYGVEEEEITARNRKTWRVEIRQIICIYLKENKFKLKEIGQMIGNRDHTTVLNCLTKGNGYIQFDEVFDSKVKDFTRSFDLYLSGI